MEIMKSRNFISFVFLYALLLFCEAKFPSTSGAPAPTTGNENKSFVTIPAMARKAGGGRRSELLEKQDLPEITKGVESVDGQDGNVPATTIGNENKMSSQVIPAMARKAGGSWRHALLEKKDSSEMTKVVEGEESERAADGDYNYEDSYSEEEVECPKRYFYHVRGKQCVPLRCPGGNKWRDPDTGDCTRDEFGQRYHGGGPRAYGHGSSFSRNNWSRTVLSGVHFGGRGGFKKG